MNVTRDQEEDVHHPPDPQAAECQQLPHSSPRETETEPGRQHKLLMPNTVIS